MKKIFLFLVCCIFLLTTIVNADITIRPIAGNGDVSHIAIDISELPQNVPSSVSIEVSPNGQICTGKNGQIIECTGQQSVIQPRFFTIQLYPGAQFFSSVDQKNIMQTSDIPGFPKLELYYAYQTSEIEPWENHYRIEGNVAVHASFTDRTVWITPVSDQQTNEIKDSGEIPSWENLP